MTRPMSEDTPGKQAANYGYRIRQLERRPAPVQTGGAITRAYMVQLDGQTIADATTTPLTAYEPTETIDDTGYTTDETNGRFEIEATGVYLVQLVVLWVNTFAGGKMARITTSGGNIIQDTNYWSNWCSEQDLGVNVDQVMAEALMYVDTVSTSVLVQGAVRQLSGGPEDVSVVDFSIVRLGDY